jgi:hypothetical protein
MPLFQRGSGMSFREWVGLVLVAVGLVLAPVAWAFSRPLWALAFGVMVVGLMLFFTERVSRRMKRSSESAGSGHGHPLPTDIHNYTGWRSGGRSETMDSHSSDASD